MDPKLMDALIKERRELLESIAKTEMEYLGDKNIMIIDDSEEANVLISKFLKDVGKFNIKTFEDEFAAIKEIAAEPPDLLILDILLSNVDGIKLSSMIQSLDFYHGPILYISRNPQYQIELKAFYGREVPFLRKPIDKTRFKNMVVKLLQEGGGQQWGETG